MVLPVKPTPIRFLTNSLYITMDDTPLHSIPCVTHMLLLYKMKAKRWGGGGWRRADETPITVRCVSQGCDRSIHLHPGRGGFLVNPYMVKIILKPTFSNDFPQTSTVIECMV